MALTSQQHNDISSDGEAAAVTQEEHTRFVACLERYGSEMTGREWSNMANELDWTVDRVQSYAYQYLLTICSEHEEEPRQEALPLDDDSWSMEENVLLDTLLALYLPQDGNSGHNHELDWEERVAALIPNKSPQQVRQQHERLYGRYSE